MDRRKRGADHYRAQAPLTAVEDARDLRDLGHTYPVIAEAISNTYGLDINWRTVADWCNYKTRTHG